MLQIGIVFNRIENLLERPAFRKSNAVLAGFAFGEQIKNIGTAGTFGKYIFTGF